MLFNRNNDSFICLCVCWFVQIIYLLVYLVVSLFRKICLVENFLVNKDDFHYIVSNLWSIINTQDTGHRAQGKGGFCLRHRTHTKVSMILFLGLLNQLRSGSSNLNIPQLFGVFYSFFGLPVSVLNLKLSETLFCIIFSSKASLSPTNSLNANVKTLSGELLLSPFEFPSLGNLVRGCAGKRKPRRRLQWIRGSSGSAP